MESDKRLIKGKERATLINPPIRGDEKVGFSGMLHSPEKREPRGSLAVGGPGKGASGGAAFLSARTAAISW
jgi:hypothetical protein